MDKQTELKGLMKEVFSEFLNEEKSKAEAAAKEEALAKAMEENTALKAQMEQLKNKKTKTELTVPGSDKTVKVYKGWDLKKQGEILNIADEDLKENIAKGIINVIEKSKFLRGMGINNKAIAGMEEGEASEGGYLVPTEYEDVVLAFARRESVALNPAHGISIYDMSSNTLKVAAEGTNVSVAWTDEEVDATLTKPSFAVVDLVAYRLDGYVAVTNELLDDATDDVVSRLTSQFGAAIGTEIDNQVFNGTGSPFAGILANGGYTFNSTDTTTSGVKLDHDDFANIIFTLPIEVRKGAKFYLPTNSVAATYNVKDDNNNRLVQLDGNGLMKIHGYEVVEVSNLPSTVAVNTAFGCFGNLKYYCLGRRKGVMSLDIDPYGLFLANQTRFRTVSRWDGAVGLANGFVKIKSKAS